MTWMCFYLCLLMLSSILTGVLRHYVLATNLLDIPNHRSSHTIPTPRGGGLSFVICFILASIVLFYCNKISFAVFLVVIVAGFFIAMLGFLDDHRHVLVSLRLSGHFIASGFALFLLGGMPTIFLFNWMLPPGLITNVLAVFYLVWLLNLYNFMDGIDGIAAMEAITTSLSGALLFYCCGYSYAIFLPCSLAVVAGGFLFWNFPVARIFMGDVGSSFLGFILGILSIQAGIIDVNFFWSWLIFLGVFIVDTMLTLFNRILLNESLTKAHCNHAYQHAARYYGKHRTITVSVLAINVLWLLPLGLLVGNHRISGLLGLLIAYFPLIIVAFKFNAGKNIVYTIT